MPTTCARAPSPATPRATTSATRSPRASACTAASTDPPRFWHRIPSSSRRNPVPEQEDWRAMRWFAAAAVLVLAAGCGDDDGGTGAPTVTAAEIDGAIDLSADGPRSDSGRVTIPGFDEVAV